jgi:hypothetical protein
MDNFGGVRSAGVSGFVADQSETPLDHGILEDYTRKSTKWTKVVFLLGFFPGSGDYRPGTLYSRADFIKAWGDRRKDCRSVSPDTSFVIMLVNTVLAGTGTPSL